MWENLYLDNGINSTLIGIIIGLTLFIPIFVVVAKKTHNGKLRIIDKLIVGLVIIVWIIVVPVISLFQYNYYKMTVDVLM